MSNEYFEHSIKLQPGTKARAEDVNARFDAIVIGLDKLPAPHPTLPGFAAAVAVGNPTNKDHAVTAGQAMSGGLTYAVDTGAVNAFIVDLPIAPLSYSDGLRVSFKALANITGPATINVNGLGIKQLARSNGDPLVAGDIVAGQVVSLIYNGTKFFGITPFQGQLNEIITLTSGQAAAAAASETEATTQAGIATTQAGIATTQAGTSTTQAGTATIQAGIATTKAGESSTSATSANNATIATAADRVQTGLDRVATAADRVQTGLDRTQVNTDKNTATTQAGISTTQAGISTTQAGTAATQAGIATTQAGISTTQAGISTTKAAEAAASAEAAALAGGSGGGLAWKPFSTNQTTVNGEVIAMDTTGGAKTITPNATPVAEDTFGVADQKGTFQTNNCTIAFTGIKLHGVVQTSDMVLDVKNQRVVFSYLSADTGWIITSLEPANSAWEYMPYAVMLLQDQKTSGTAGGSSIAGTQVRTLNTTVQNDIAGASLNSNQITLPAGTYRFNASALTYFVGKSKLRLYNVTTSQYILEGINSAGGQASYVESLVNVLEGFYTFTSQTVLELRHYTQSVEATDGLGQAVSQGTEVYASLEITKIGNNYAPRLITTDARLQMVAGLDYTGNVLGFDITKTGATQLTITPGTCKNHDGTVDLYTTVNTVINDAVLANTIYHLAVVKLNNGTMTVKRYASEAAMAADVGVNITHFRWIGEWLSNGSANYVVGIMVNGLMQRGKASECVISNGVTTSYATVNHTTQMTPSRVEAIKYGVRDDTTSAQVWANDDGTNSVFSLGQCSTSISDTPLYAFGNGGVGLVPLNTSRQFKSDTGTLDLLVHQIKYRR